MIDNVSKALEYLEIGERKLQPHIGQWRDIYYRTSLHTTGACPRFLPLRDNVLGLQWITPMGWLHERYDAIFDNNLLNKHAREPEITRNWRKSVYRPYTQQPLLEVIQTTQAAIFGDSKYTLIVDDKNDNDYIWGNNFEGKNFVGYFEFMFKSICEDPNSLFMVVPREPGYETTSTKIEPIIKHIPSREIVYISDKEIIFYEPERLYGWWVNEMGYMRFENRDGKWYQMDGAYGYYAHLLQYRPAHFAGGIWNTHRYFDSYLKPAIAYCDDFVSAHSDVQMINKEAAHPFIQAVSSDCPSCQGVGQVHYCNACKQSGAGCVCDIGVADSHLANCSSCRGSGKQSYNPADWLIVPPDMADKDLIRVIQFDVNTNKFLAEYAASILLGIKKALHQEFVEEAQSGVAKDIDRSSQFLYRSTVCKGVWDLMERCLVDILSIRNTATRDGKRLPEIPKYILVKPTDFDLKTEYDLLEEYKESTEAQMPEFVRQKQVEMYTDKIFGGDEVMKRKACLVNQMDAYSVTSISDKTALLSAGGIAPREFQFSNLLPTLLDGVARVKGREWFIKATYDDVRAEVDKAFEKVPELPKKQESTEVKVNA